MEIIYVTFAMSNKKMDELMKSSKAKLPTQAIQKFSNLLARGFVENDVKIKTFTLMPMSREISNKLFWNDKKEIENGIEYNYVPFINFPIIRQLSACISIIFLILKECFHNKKEKVFVCDILYTTMAMTTLVLSKILRFRCVGLVTDLPEYVVGMKGIATKINKTLQTKYDDYILLTEYMNDVVNTKKKKYVVVEGISNYDENSLKNIEKHKEKVCVYAGALFEKFGVKNLIDAFCMIDDDNIRLHLYGDGELTKYIKTLKDKRVKYFGIVNNDVVMEDEVKATLLINPRFSTGEYTLYSFPSKNMEYMSTGTPLLTTRLPGIPKEYNDFVYFFDDETVEGMKKTLEDVLRKDEKELEEMGKLAKEFVLKNKNSKSQVNKILEMLKN